MIKIQITVLKCLSDYIFVFIVCVIAMKSSFNFESSDDASDGQDDDGSIISNADFSVIDPDDTMKDVNGAMTDLNIDKAKSTPAPTKKE